MLPRILVVDDERLILDCFRYAFPPDEYTLDAATSATEAIKALRQNSYDAVIVDVQLPDRPGFQLLNEIQEIDAQVPVILMTGHGTANTAIEAMRKGAFDYLIKPIDPDHLLLVVGRALEVSRMTRNPLTRTEQTVTATEDEGLVGYCPAMQEVFRQIGRVAGQEVTVLILGESGTGKELVARAIYQYSKRADKPFRAINCAAIPETLLESELFGHEKGSYTGAGQRRIGKFEQCDGGTLFLDEIGDMTPLTQSKVLRVLQDQQFERVGGNETVRTNVRLIAATNRNLADMMDRGTFRNDLYFRLNVYTIHLPPLRERKGDLPLLVNHFLGRFNRELNKSIKRVSPETMDLLNDYAWPGNLRELQSVLKHAVVVSNSSILLPEFLPQNVRDFTSRPIPVRTATGDPRAELDDALRRFVDQQLHSGSDNLYEQIIRSIDFQLLTEILNQVDGNVTRAAALLGISRSTLRSKLATLGITLDRSIRITEEVLANPSSCERL